MTLEPQDGAAVVAVAAVVVVAAPCRPVKLPKSASGSRSFDSKLGVLALRGKFDGVVVCDTGEGFVSSESQLPKRLSELGAGAGVADFVALFTEAKLPKLEEAFKLDDDDDDDCCDGDKVLVPRRGSNGSKVANGSACWATGAAATVGTRPAFNGKSGNARLADEKVALFEADELGVLSKSSISR